MDFKSLEPLALAVGRAGFPVLAEILGTVIPFPGNLVAKTVLNGIAAALGTPPDDPQSAADAINNNPTAAEDKLQAIQEEHKSDWEFAKLQVQQNNAELATGSIFLSGWRPAFAWSCVVMVWYQAFGSVWWHMHVIPTDTFNPIWAAFGGLLGLRSVEKWLQVAGDNTKIKIIPEAVKKVFRRKPK